MKYETMIKILFFLLSKDKVTSKQIATRFNISPRTVARYITAIGLAGVPLISKTGKDGGYHIAESFRLTASFLSESEFNATIATLISCNEKISSVELTSAIDKLSALKTFNENDLNVTCGNFVIDGDSWDGSENISNIIGVLNKAIDKKTVVSVKYRDKGGENSVRDIEPVKIIFKCGIWYVYAYCRLRKKFRTFKISRMTYATSTREKFTQREIPSEDPVNFEKWFNSLPKERIELEVYQPAMTEVEEWLGVSGISKKTKDSEIFSVVVPYDKWLVSKIIAFGANVKVLAPAKLKEDIVTMLKTTLDSYRNY